MKAIVKAHPETGKVITRGIGKESGKPFGTLMVQQTAFETQNGFLVPKNRCAFVRIAEQHLDALEAILKDGQEYPENGRIVRTESFSPIYEGQSPKINPETGEAHLVNGKKVYFTDEWSNDANAEDRLLSASVAKEEVLSEEEGI